MDNDLAPWWKRKNIPFEYPSGSKEWFRIIEIFDDFAMCAHMTHGYRLWRINDLDLKTANWL